MMDGRFTWTIREILADPRYRDFARAATEHGKQLLPDAFPWKYLGLTDAEFMAFEIPCLGGGTPSVELKRDWLRVVRAQEQLIVTWWHWWPSWQEIDGRRAEGDPPEPGTREAVLAEMNPCRLGNQGMLFY